jgi:hypothetical protein
MENSLTNGSFLEGIGFPVMAAVYCFLTSSLLVPLLWQFIAGLSLWKPRFALGLVHVAFVVDRVAHWDRFFSEFCGFSPYLLFHRGSILIYDLRDEQ